MLGETCCPVGSHTAAMLANPPASVLPIHVRGPQNSTPATPHSLPPQTRPLPSPCRPCRNGPSCRRQNCSYAHKGTSLIRLLQWLGSARHSLDVCVFSITCDELADALLAAHSESERGAVKTCSLDCDACHAQLLPVVDDKHCLWVVACMCAWINQQACER